MPKFDLPTYYYHDHFMDMMESVASAYAHILRKEHWNFIERFKNLTKDEQCLYIRMANRKGHVFHKSALRYEEIDSNACTALLDCGFICNAGPEQYSHVLAIMTKERLLSIAKKVSAGHKASWPKAKFVEHILTQVPYQTFADIDEAADYLIQRDGEIVEYLLYLYFGKSQEDLKSFTLRDLKIVRVNSVSALKARFGDTEEAETCFTYSSLLKRLMTRSDEEFRQGASTLKGTSEIASEYAKSLRAKVAYKIGQFFEKKKEFEQAIAVYRLSQSHECNERVVRLEYAHGNKQQVRLMLENMIDDPASDDEYVFASDFYARKFNGQRVGTYTDLLRMSETIVIDDVHRGSPEYGAMSYFRRQGWTAHRTENDFWHSLFGLLFWDELYANDNMLHSGFDRIPHCLKDRSFRTIFADNIAVKLDRIRSGGGLLMVVKTITSCKGKPNGLFSWYGLNIDALRDFFKTVKPAAIAAIVELLATDFYAVRDGFPDLMLATKKSLKFVEIKAEGDLIRRNQLTRLRQLNRAGLQAEICRVDYRYDPEQVYVVVDIETTGQSSDRGRVTEVGAVKVKNHQIIDEWHSLINPQQRIPAFITKLTGISDAMVRDAPLFSSVADSLIEFMGDAIFVAHNVGFDYGFLAEECRRLDKSFRYPKFCTVANMRKHYPGQDSYSLGHLCQRYNIRLENHHRAMDDAKAAASLLSMINRKREDTAALRDRA